MGVPGWDACGVVEVSVGQRERHSITRAACKEQLLAQPGFITENWFCCFPVHRERTCTFVRCRWSGTSIQDQELELSDLAA